MKIYDCFSYLDEDLLLEIRLNILDKYVDYFVIVEGNKTWQNNNKKLRFDIKKFENFKNKIIYVPVNDMPDGENPWVRENFQRNCISRGLLNSSPEDIIIISDVDEIPNLENIKKLLENKRYAAFKQKGFYYKLNMQNITLPDWYGSRICKNKYLKSPQWLRSLKFKKRPFWRIDKFRLNSIIENGGWHFCNLKNPEDLLYKYKNMAETRDNFFAKDGIDGSIDEKYLSVEQIKNSIEEGKNLVGKKEYFKKIELDDSFPEYILKNRDKYKNWIK
jgi:beta-1,4-mannosyl-glycoprotein beta-1,4-N-acetylglucosaminyltransferase|tara:strand:- start:221 stop:1045 length:825 start_codon:yes stop_codon:yes gene_type:complete